MEAVATPAESIDRRCTAAHGPDHPRMPDWRCARWALPDNEKCLNHARW
ncbi:hypothetical protein QMK19_03590 [Streptomyces sp. H10-C2]|nr:hypothetical protein [Streptomyces sp. H10-C2]MDJ0342270.1 hypothetical protein [Streptomyces sp. PH10-H1]MDJ0368784.1 hypothetical protein [Streptomyces sp. H10-C2]